MINNNLQQKKAKKTRGKKKYISVMENAKG